MEQLPIAIRPALADDFPYILKTWSIDYHKVYPINNIPNSIYVPAQTAIIKKLVQRSECIIACIDDEPTTIVGYLIYQPVNDLNIVVHWGQTKGIFRRMGVLKTLLDSLQTQNKNIICTHIFSLFKELKDRYNLIYDPTLLQDLVNDK